MPYNTLRTDHRQPSRRSEVHKLVGCFCQTVGNCTGGQRIHNVEKFCESINNTRDPEAGMEDYLSAFDLGPAPYRACVGILAVRGYVRVHSQMAVWSGMPAAGIRAARVDDTCEETRVPSFLFLLLVEDAAAKRMRRRDKSIPPNAESRSYQGSQLHKNTWSRILSASDGTPCQHLQLSIWKAW
ncbi:hypothetical protein BJ166DRAFT_491262 [Pestalotiopsis sp. NC0098]|nr:hypothetical protein BJ166DRAFT_491262 [Pestalotiopsis sp. NC0098]